MIQQTSIEALFSLTPKQLESDRGRILWEISSRGGLTCDEVEVITGLSHQTCSARFRDLAKGTNPLIIPSGEKRPTRTGRRAMVWIYTSNQETNQ